MSVPSKPLRISGTCPICDSIFFFDPSLKTFKDVNCSTDCLKCGVLLLVEKGIVYPFHEKLHEGDPRWPKDGAGSASISTEQGMPPGPHKGGGRVIDGCVGGK